MMSHPGSREAGSRPVVLMGFAEAMAAIEVAWSLQEAGFRVIAFARPQSRPGVRHVPGIQVHEVPAPEQDAQGTIAAVRRLIGLVGPDVLLPLDDYGVWVCSRLDDQEVPIAGPTGAAARLALDKREQLSVAADAGLSVPATQALDDVREAEPVEFPVVIKPATALHEAEDKLVRLTGVVCADRAEFDRAVRGRAWLGPVLIQPLIRGVGEGLFGHAEAGGVTGWSAHRRVRMVNPQGSASSACRSQPVQPELVAAIERFLAAVQWRGLFMIEFLRGATGTPWFMELNGRAWGSMALARRRGFEYPAWAVQQAIGTEFRPGVPVAPPHVLCRNLGLELVHLLFVARGPQSKAQNDWPSLAHTARQVFSVERGGHLYNWKPSQPHVLLADTAQTLGQYLRKARAGRR